MVSFYPRQVSLYPVPGLAFPSPTLFTPGPMTRLLQQRPPIFPQLSEDQNPLSWDMEDRTGLAEMM
jgi:hypothetical protein